MHAHGVARAQLDRPEVRLHGVCAGRMHHDQPETPCSSMWCEREVWQRQGLYLCERLCRLCSKQSVWHTSVAVSLVLVVTSPLVGG